MTFTPWPITLMYWSSDFISFGQDADVHPQAVDSHSCSRLWGFCGSGASYTAGSGDVYVFVWIVKNDRNWCHLNSSSIGCTKAHGAIPTYHGHASGSALQTSHVDLQVMSSEEPQEKERSSGFLGHAFRVSSGRTGRFSILTYTQGVRFTSQTHGLHVALFG